MDSEDSGQREMGLGMGVGLVIGAALGLITDNLALWFPMGIVIGVTIGAFLFKMQSTDP